MGPFAVVIATPWLQVLIPLVEVSPVFCVGPFTERGLDKTFGLAVGLRRLGFGAAVFDGQLLTGAGELP
jgi:hypothetical protein